MNTGILQVQDIEEKMNVVRRLLYISKSDSIHFNSKMTAFGM
jgi:hypothetical protein